MSIRDRIIARAHEVLQATAVPEPPGGADDLVELLHAVTDSLLESPDLPRLLLAGDKRYDWYRLHGTAVTIAVVDATRAELALRGLIT